MITEALEWISGENQDETDESFQVKLDMREDYLTYFWIKLQLLIVISDL